MSAPYHRVCTPIAAPNPLTARLHAVAARTKRTVRQPYVGPHAPYIMRPFESPSRSRFSDGSFGVHYSANRLDVATAARIPPHTGAA